MAIDKTSWIWAKYYEVPPEKKNIKQCYSHGCDHRTYKWAPGVDPRWSDEQKEAYWAGFENTSPPNLGD